MVVYLTKEFVLGCAIFDVPDSVFDNEATFVLSPELAFHNGTVAPSSRSDIHFIEPKRSYRGNEHSLDVTTRNFFGGAEIRISGINSTILVIVSLDWIDLVGLDWIGLDCSSTGSSMKKSNYRQKSFDENRNFFYRKP